nr:response regulator [Paenibacillus typhae]
MARNEVQNLSTYKAVPVMGGLETMQELKKQGSTIPVIILTTYNEDDLMISGLAIGAKG